MSSVEQHGTKSSPFEISPQEIASALQGSLLALHPLEKSLFDSGVTDAGLLLSQVKVILLLAQQGRPANSGHFLALLESAQRVPGGKG